MGVKKRLVSSKELHTENETKTNKKTSKRGREKKQKRGCTSHTRYIPEIVDRVFDNTGTCAALAIKNSSEVGEVMIRSRTASIRSVLHQIRCIIRIRE